MYLGFYLMWGSFQVWGPLLLFVYFGFEEIFNVVKLFRIPHWDDVVSIDWCKWAIISSLIHKVLLDSNRTLLLLLLKNYG